MSRGRSSRAAAWLDQRTGFITAARAWLQDGVPGGASWFYALGGAAAFLVLLEFATGIFLAFYYAPSAATAWASVAYIQDQVTVGWFVRGLHSFGSSALVVVTGLHFLQVLVWGAYKAPREANWIIGLAMLLLVLGFALTGYGLPWDQAGYWAKVVETSILGTTPVLGPALERIVQGGGGYGNFTVTHFFTIHALVLPAALATLLVAHVVLVRRHRVTPSWRLTDEEARRRAEPYYPNQAARDLLLSALVAALVVFLVVRRHGAPLEGPADAASGYMARPEWYAIPLYQLRMLFEGPLEIIATMVIPGLIGGLLVALPFLDRRSSRHPRDRAPVMACLLTVSVATGGLAAVAIDKDARDPSFRKHRAQVAQEAAFARELAKRGVLPEGGLAVLKNDPAFAARELFGEECATCHTLTGAGGGDGPDLADYNSRAWLLAFLKDPQGPRFMAGAKKPEKGAMKPVNGTAEELEALIEVIYAQSGAADANAALAAQGKELFSTKNCDSCHSIEDATEEAVGPNLVGRGTLDYLRRVIDHAGDSALYGDRAKMPKFGGKLSREDSDGLAKFVRDLRKR